MGVVANKGSDSIALVDQVFAKMGAYEATGSSDKDGLRVD